MIGRRQKSDHFFFLPPLPLPFLPFFLGFLMSLTVEYVYVCIIINTCRYVCIYIYMYTVPFLSFFLGFVMSLRTKCVYVCIRIHARGCVYFGPFLGVFEVVDCQVCMCLFKHKYMWISFVIF